TTLNGEGLQHEDGHSHVLASAVPNLKAYDPAFADEIAAIVRDGIRRMFGPEPEDIFYYLTLYNENYVQPPKPEGVDEGIVRGLYRFAEAPGGTERRATILFSGVAWQAAMAAREILAADYDVGVECWSATSYKCLREEALSVERWNRLNPGEEARVPYVASALSSSSGPVVAVTDFMKAVPDMVARWVPQPFIPLGTDGFGRSDTRAALRAHFEVDAENVVVAVLSGLAQTGEAKEEEVAAAIKRFGLDPDKGDPRDA
ncbi:MAG: transketolase-like TK C-terminal-containing protein, partial [Actinomycetota bacterium]